MLAPCAVQCTVVCTHFCFKSIFILSALHALFWINHQIYIFSSSPKSRLAQQHDVSLQYCSGGDQAGGLLLYSAVPDDAVGIGNEPDERQLKLLVEIEIK